MIFGNEKNVGFVNMPEIRYCIEINDGPSPYNWFAYFDTDDHLAQFLFDYYHVDVAVEGEYGVEGDPYRIVMVRFPGEQRRDFLKVVDLLPGLMEYCGKGDYDEYCLSFLADADRFMLGKWAGRDIPLQ